MLLLAIADRFRSISKYESGLMLLETVLATAIIGMVAIGLLSGMSIAAKSDFIITRLSDAEALARSQMEQIKNSSYIDYSDPDHGVYELITDAAEYAIEVSCSPISPITCQPLGPNEDAGIQLITIVVRNNGEQVTTLKGYKVRR